MYIYMSENGVRPEKGRRQSWGHLHMTVRSVFEASSRWDASRALNPLKIRSKIALYTKTPD
mgnify:CR=1 FL=1